MTSAKCESNGPDDPGKGQKSPLFSVIIPTFDRPEFLVEAIQSVLAQTVSDLELLIIDDGGTQPIDTPTDPRIRVLRRDQSGGPAAARNTGLDAARGRYVAFLDDDDLYSLDRLECALPLLEIHPVVVCWRTGGTRQLDGDVKDVILDDLVPHLGQVTIWRELAPRLGERFQPSDDVAWWLDLAYSFPVRTVPHVGYLYRMHDTPRHHSIGASARADSLRRLLASQGPYFDAHPKAKAFQWKQIGLAELRSGNLRAARRALLTSLYFHPEGRTVWHLLRAGFGNLSRTSVNSIPQ